MGVENSKLVAAPAGLEARRSLEILRLPWSSRGELREALCDHPLVLLLTPGLDEAGVVEVARGLGRVIPPTHPRFTLAGHPLLMMMGNLRDEHGNKLGGSSLAIGWHADNSHYPQPADITMLYARVVPERGGDTQFGSMERVYAELDPATRERWSGLMVEHVATSPDFDGTPHRVAVHPLVVRHPESGRPLVYASPAYTQRVLGVTPQESDAILRHIAASLATEDVSHRWTPGDLLAWDNRAVVHRATAYDTAQPRCLWRASVHLSARA